MARALGCPHVRPMLCLSFAVLFLAGCSSLGKPPYCPAKPAAVAPPPASGPGGPLHQRALAYDRLFQEKLQPRPYGGVVNVIFAKGQGSGPDSLGALQGYDDRQDSAIWTGTYLAAEAFRYAATADPGEKQEALRNARSAAQTLHLFLKVTDQPGLLARFAGPLDETQTYLSSFDCPAQPVPPDKARLCCAGNQNCSQSQWDPKLFWLGGTTRDQYSGWFFGMGIAYRLIDDPELRQLIRTDMGEIVTALKSQKWIIRGPDGKPARTSGSDVEELMQAAWLLLAAQASDDPAYCKDYEKLVRDPLRLDVLLAEDDFDWTNRYFQYYGFNLSFLAYYNLIQLEPNAARKSAYLKSLEDHVYKEVKGTGNSFFDYIALAVGASAPDGTLKSAQGSLGQFPEPPGSWSCVLPPKSDLNQASIDLYDIARELDPNKPFVLPEARQAYPLASWCRQDFLWQQTPYAICCCPVPQSEQWSPYQNACNCTQPALSDPDVSTLVYPGVDYLVAYWMGRYHGFLEPGS